MVKIVLASRHRLYREAVVAYCRQAILNIDMHDVDSRSDFETALSSGAPALAILDSDLPECQSAGFLDDVPKALIIDSGAPSSHDRSAYCGVFSKAMSCRDFVSGLDEILRGRSFFIGDNPDALVESGKIEKSSASKIIALTLREKEVLAFLARGASNKDIARALDLQVVTIKLHVRGICRKLGAANRTQAALTAREKGLF